MTTIERYKPPPDAIARRERLAELLSGCALRHESSLEELYRTCSAQLNGVLLRILKIEAIAEEALQETFVKIWDNADRYEPRSGSPMTWMSSIARNQALDVLRRRGVRENLESTDMVTLIDSTPDSSKPLHEMSSDAQLLQTCLDELPEPTRRCIVGAFCEGYSHEELSESTAVPLGTVKSWIRRGLIRLRRCVDEHA